MKTRGAFLEGAGAMLEEACCTAHRKAHSTKILPPSIWPHLLGEDDKVFSAGPGEGSSERRETQSSLCPSFLPPCC